MTIDEKLAARRLAEKRTELEELSSLSAEAREPVELDQQSVGATIPHGRDAATGHEQSH